MTVLLDKKAHSIVSKLLENNKEENLQAEDKYGFCLTLHCCTSFIFGNIFTPAVF